jgi:Protein of unknown function (DUF1194)
MRRAMISFAFSGALCSMMFGGAQAASIPVDLELILLVDVSRSMDSDEQKMQRDGYVAAIQHPDVIEAIAHGLHGTIALTYVEWAGPQLQQTVVDWGLIDSPNAAKIFAEELARAPIQGLRGTSIANALAYAASRFDHNDIEGMRRVVDVSGDGPNNMGLPIEATREQVLAQGIAINGLPVMIKRPGGFASINNLDVYYEDCVIGGPGAFLIVVRSADQFADAIRRKLTLEIAGRQPRFQPAAALAPQKRIDCLIGEKLRQQWMRE